MENALDTKVLVRFGKEGAAALKEFETKKEFELTLVNYSKDTDYSFDLSYENILTQGMNDKNEMFEKVLEGANLSFDKKTVTVKKGSTETVKVTLSANSVVDNFVEGFIKFNSKDKNQPSLGMPFMGFSGDWGKEKIVDAPVYDGNKTVYSNTSIVAKSKQLNSVVVLGSNLDQTIKSEDIVFSPNNDNEFDKIYVKTALLRSAQDIILDIVDKNDGSENVLRTLNHTEYKRRPQYEKFKQLGDAVHSPDDADSWDGYLYKSSDGSYEMAKDGKYFVRIKARVNANEEYQTTYMPVKVDTKKPTVNVISSKENPDKTFTITYELSDENGIFMDLGAYLDGEEGKVTSEGKIYTAVFKQKPAENAKGLFIAMAADKAMNILEFSQLLNGRRVDIFDYDASLTKGTFYNVDENGTILFNGTASKDVKTLKIGYSLETAVEFKLDHQNRFSQRFQLKEGKHPIYALGYDANGKMIVNGYMDEVSKKGEYTEKFVDISYDKTKPVITLTSPALTDNSYISPDGKVKIEGTVSDDLTEKKDIKLSVMGNNVKVDQNGKFATVIDVPLNRVVKMSATDKFGNTQVSDFYVKYDDAKDEGKFSFDNLTQFTVLNAENKDVKDGVFTITGFLTNSNGKLYINEKEVTLKENNRFEFKLPVKQGINTTNVKFKDKEGKLLSNYGYKVIYDKDLPTLKLEKPSVFEDKIYTNSDQVEFKGSIADNTLGHLLFINGNMITKFTELGARGEKDTEKAFEFVQKNVKAKDIMKVEFADAVGNFKVMNYEVVLDKDAPTISIENVEEGKIYDGSVTPVIKTDKDVKELLVHLNRKPWTAQTITESDNYVLEVKATDYAGNVTMKTVSFKVDAKPVIETDEVKIMVNSHPDFTKLIKATDKEDGDVSSYIMISQNFDTTKAGVYKIKASVVDKAGNRVEKEITLKVMAAPTINGAANRTVVKGESIDLMAGITATDEKDGNITDKIKVTGEVDKDKVGSYKVKYEVTDSDENTVSREVTITVSETAVNPGKDEKPAESVILKDDNYGIKISGTVNTLNKDWKVIAKLLDKKYEGKKTVAYDITLVDANGNKVQPRAAVKVSIPVDSTLDMKNIKVYYDDLNKLNLLDSHIEELSAVFNVEHFSVYVLSNDTVADASNGSDVKPSEGNKDTANTSSSNTKNSSKGSYDLPETGEMRSIIFLAGGAILIGIATIVFVTGRKKKNK